MAATLLFSSSAWGSGVLTTEISFAQPANSTADLLAQQHVLKTGTRPEFNFKPVGSAPLNLGLSEKSVWLKIDTSISKSGQYVVEINNEGLHYIDFYLLGTVTPDTYQDGLERPFAERKNRLPAFIFHAKGGQDYKLLVRIKSRTPLFLPVVVKPLAQVAAERSVDDRFIAFMLGLFAIIIVYNLFLAGATKEFVFIWYVFFVALGALTQFTIIGVSSEYLWPGTRVSTLPEMPVLFAGLALIAKSKFVIRFLELDRHSYYLKRLWQSGPYIGLLGILMSVFLPGPAVAFGMLLGILSALAMIATGLFGLGRLPNALIFLLAASTGAMGIILLLLGHTGILPYSFLNHYSVVLGLAGESVLFSLALGGEIRRLTLEKERANIANAAKSTFLANMSHEIRTPMTAIIGAAEILDSDPIKPERMRYIKMIRSAGQNLLFLVNDILDLSKIEAGRMSIRKTPFRLKDIMFNVVEISQVAAGQKSVQFDFDYALAEEEHSMLIGDPDRIQQVLLNLTSNAVKFTPAGGRVEIRFTEQANNRIKFTVKDTGIGIGKDKQAMVFDPFSQVEDKVTAAGQGTGLGLAISKHLVALMGGQIRMESEIGKGTSVSFSLPLPLAEYIKHAHTAQRFSFGKLRILLVEDNPDNRALLMAFFQDEKFEWTIAQDGAEGFATFCESQFDLVLMDIYMPVMDGYECTEKIRQYERETKQPRTPILVLTASAFEENIKAAQAAGCDDHLTKPFERENIRRKIADVLDATGSQ